MFKKYVMSCRHFCLELQIINRMKVRPNDNFWICPHLPPLYWLTVNEWH